MNLLTKEHKPFLYLITFAAIFRLLVAPHLGLGVDEAHYLIYALNLDYSYFDHPPLVGWVHYIFTSLFGISEIGARISAIIIGFVSSIMLYRLLYDIEKNASLAFVGVLALHSAFMFNALFLMLMPDTLLFVLVVPIILSVCALEKTPKASNWLILGLLLGLAGLSKYTAILFVVPILLYFIIKKRFDFFYNPKILLTIITALIIVTPVFYWNIQNDWISFTYQSNHVVGSSHINWKDFGASIATQLLTYNPFISFVAFYGLYRAFKSKNEILFLSALFGAVIFLFFTYASLYKMALPHWAALFYLLFIPIGSYYLFEKSLRWKKYLKYAMGFGIVLSSLLYIEIATKIVPLPDEHSLQLDIYGFEKVMQRTNAQIKEPNREAIAVTNWTLASRAILYNAKYSSEVFLLDDRYDQFDIWQKQTPLGKDIIVIDPNFAHKDIERYMKCDSVEEIDAFAILEKSKEPNIHLIRCKNYQGLR